MAIYKNTPPIITNGLVLYLDAGNRISYTSGSTTWTDLSGQGNNGTLKVIGTPSTSASFDLSNQGNIVFNQSGSYIDFGNILNYTSENFSFSYWVNITSFTTSVANQGPIIFYKGAFNTNGYYNQISQTGNVTLRTNQSTTGQASSAHGSIITGSWTNVTFTRSGSSIRVYINGIDRTTVVGTHIDPASSTDSFTLNVYQVTIGGNNIFGNIRLANFMNYNRALSDQEVAQNYNATKTRFELT